MLSATLSLLRKTNISYISIILLLILNLNFQRGLPCGPYFSNIKCLAVSVPYISLLTPGTSSSEIFQRRPRLINYIIITPFFFFFNSQWRVSHWNPYICFCLSPTYIYCMAKRRLNIIFQIDFHIFLIVLKPVLSDLLNYTAIYLIPTHER